MPNEIPLPIETIHCRHCRNEHGNYDPSKPVRSDFYHLNMTHLDGTPRKWKLIPVHCMLGRFHTDTLLATGPDSGVFKVDNEQLVMKIYQRLSLPELSRYKQEMDEMDRDMEKGINVNGKEYTIEINRITNICETPYGIHCVLGYSPLVTGLNYHDYFRQQIAETKGHLPTEYINFTNPISKHIQEYYINKYDYLPNDFYYYLHENNFVVNFEEQKITITDIANNIQPFLESISTPLAEKR